MNKIKKTTILFNLLLLLLIPISIGYASGSYFSWTYSSSNDWLSGNDTTPNTFNWSSRITNASLDGSVVSHINWIQREHWFSPTYRNAIPFNPNKTGSPTVGTFGYYYGPKEYNIYYIDSTQSRLIIDYNDIPYDEGWAASEAKFPYLGNESSYTWGHEYLGYTVNAVAGWANSQNDELIDHGPNWSYAKSVSLPK